MWLKFFHNESKTIAGAAVLIGVLSFCSRMMGLIRDRILAGAFGAGDTLDIYYAAFKIPDFLFNLIVIGALSASFIPLFVKFYYRPDGKEYAWRLTNNVLNLIGCMVLVGTVVLFFLREPLSAWIAPGFSLGKQHMVAHWTGIMLLAQVFLAASVVFGSALQGMKRFFLYALAPIFYNIGIIVGALWLTRLFGPIGLAWGVALGAFFHFSIQIYGVLAAGYRYIWTFEWRDQSVQEIFRLMGPRLLGLAVAQVNVVLMTVIASWLLPGSLTILNFAYNIQFFPVGIIGIAYAVAVFPVLSDHAEQRHPERFVSAFSASVRQTLFLIVPMMFVFLILRAQIVRVVVGAGKFGWSETIQTANTLAFFALSFFSQSIVYLLARAYFALRDTMTPFIIGLATAVINLLASLYFTQWLGVPGFGAAFTLSSVINMALLWVPLRARMGNLDVWRILSSLYIITTAGVIAALVMQILKPLTVLLVPLNTFFGVFLQGAIAGGIGLLVYAGIAWILKSPEMRDLTVSIQKKLFRKSSPEEPISSDSPVL
jgi:putative peptidoglycan lipid II flippase